MKFFEIFFKNYRKTQYFGKKNHMPSVCPSKRPPFYQGLHSLLYYMPKFYLCEKERSFG